LIRDKFDLGDIDILKVPHHGSRFQDSSFLSEVSPEISLISVGDGNSYGHPNSEIIQELAGLGSRVARTDREGPISVAWRFDDGSKRYIFTMKTMRKEWWRIQWL
jgi:beta-lactamase superfamily II metal-dependent hydrolase